VKKTQLALDAKNDGAYQEAPLVRDIKIVYINQKEFIQSVVDRLKSKLCSDPNYENAQYFRTHPYWTLVQ
jgi:hypothetical protein